MKQLLSKLLGAKAENFENFEISSQKYVTYLLLLLPVLTFLLLACGGGGGGQQSHP
ncbi:MAG: hypothetical protein M0T73_15905 [Deltaproteobacteria bacterium]|nr:hypothetical protein [Deltaproteobacteria bacterium]